MKAKPILDALNKGEVHIWYTSLNSGKELDSYYTLEDRHIGKIDPNSDKIVAYDTIDNKWEDIEVSTINQWVYIPK